MLWHPDACKAVAFAGRQPPVNAAMASQSFVTSRRAVQGRLCSLQSSGLTEPGEAQHDERNSHLAPHVGWALHEQRLRQWFGITLRLGNSDCSSSRNCSLHRCSLLAAPARHSMLPPMTSPINGRVYLSWSRLTIANVHTLTLDFPFKRQTHAGVQT